MQASSRVSVKCILQLFSMEGLEYSLWCEQIYVVKLCGFISKQKHLNSEFYVIYSAHWLYLAIDQ